ncbi:response regulator transcription factor [Gracilibacillus alcaliphilus]|uniref:response regulator transcription factor n=1 Tax=Gracilibacillus alcaliphilus TaxID=1401441 RepID=UPI0019570FBC|nr:response regulator [Gracilibacillus alcaliphilus]MBM7677194.1 two-component system response regulator YesN [Gracilibacillus alcaliphilus]
MVCRIVIADDEPLITQGLANTLPWEELEVEVVGTAQNGLEAFEMLSRTAVDILITDVYMPEMDGIDLSKKVVQDFPETQIIMISGYDEFEYAREAMRIGVQDYLLKPVNIEELLNLVKKVKKDIVNHKVEQESKSQSIIKQYLSEQIFQVPPSTTEEQLADLVSEYCMIAVEKKDYSNLVDGKLTKHPLELNKAERLINRHDFSALWLEIHENQLILFLYTQNQLLKQTELELLMDELVESYGHNILTVAAPVSEDVKQIHLLYQTMNECLIRHRGTGTTRIGWSKAEENFSSDSTEVNHSIIEMVLRQESQGLAREVHQLMGALRANGSTLDEIVSELKDIEDTMINKVQAKLFAAAELFFSQKLDTRIYNNDRLLEELFLEDLKQLIACLATTNQHHWIIRQVQEYMHSNYQKDIKAAEVAADHYITPNYFSMLFRQQTGYSYSEYLNRIRIDKAKELLVDTSNKVFEIAEYVGYREYKYFVQVFKNHTDVTPTQYRKLHSIKK